MHSRLGANLVVFGAAFVLMACSVSSRAQQAITGTVESAPSAITPASIPDAPTPQIEVATSAESESAQAQDAPLLRPRVAMRS
jgi:guanyl-specific ribonuclease Sa